MAGGQHRVDEPRRAEQVRVTQMNRSGRKGRHSCVDAEVCANLMISKRKKPKKLLTPPTSLEIARLPGPCHNLRVADQRNHRDQMVHHPPSSLTNPVDCCSKLDRCRTGIRLPTIRSCTREAGDRGYCRQLSAVGLTVTSECECEARTIIFRCSQDCLIELIPKALA